MEDISLLAKCFNTAGWYIGVLLSMYALVLMSLLFFKRSKTANKFAITGDAENVIMVGVVALLGVIGDMLGFGVQPDKELSPTGFMLSLVCSISIPVLFIWTLFWSIGKIRSYIPDEETNEDEKC